MYMPQTCFECPMARPLYDDRFSCGNNLSKVVRGHFLATAECRDAVENHPERYFQPKALPDLQDVSPESVCDHIHLHLNWLDVYGDECEIRDGETVIEVSHHWMTAKLKKRGDRYYCDRLAGIVAIDPYWLALHLVHPDYLYLVVDAILADRSLMPDYL
jgi:hypothetical protein